LRIMSLAYVFLFGTLFCRDYRFRKEVNSRPAVKKTKAPVGSASGEELPPDYVKEFDDTYRPDKALFDITDHNFCLNGIAFAGCAVIGFLDFILSLSGL